MRFKADIAESNNLTIAACFSRPSHLDTFLGPGLAALPAECDPSRVLALFFWRRVTIGLPPRRNCL
jgi:hypothetical protein